MDIFAVAAKEKAGQVEPCGIYILKQDDDTITVCCLITFISKWLS